MKQHLTFSALRAALVAVSLWAGVASAQTTTLFTCDFDIQYSGYSTGYVTGGTEEHGENYDFATWHWWPNVSSSTLTSMQSTYTALTSTYFGGSETFNTYMFNYLDTTTSSTENGFMMMSTYDQRTRYSGNFNAYILFTGIDASNADVVDVRFYQYYRKYYDYCYIDYSTNGSSWTQVEINVRGVDIAVNGTLQGFATYTLPVAAAGSSNLSLRLRYKSLDSYRSAYGYYWIVDDFSVLSAPANRIRTYGDEYVEGHYRTIPQGMQINPAWYALVQNNGAYSQTNMTATLKHLNATQTTSSTVATYNNGTLSVSAWKEMICDPAGWLLTDSLGYRGWYGYTAHNLTSPHGTGTPLPTSTVGDHYLYAQLANNAVSHTYDTNYYRVVAADANNIYTWAHDNGVLTNSYNNHWLYGYVLSGGNWYTTTDAEEVHYYYPGYTVTSRYTTGSSVPAGWRILGVEIVASPVEGFQDVGSKLSAVLQRDSFSTASWVNFINMNTGASVHTVTANEVNNSSVIGRNSHGYREPGQYNTVRILFPEQPMLTANTSYRIGYRIEDTSYFAPALANQTSYRIASPSNPNDYDTIIYFRNNAATAKYGTPYLANSYDSYNTDPSRGSDGYSNFAFNQENAPMIRMLVGPYRPALHVMSYNTDMGDAYGGGFYSTGDTVILTAVPHEGYRFSHWQDNNTSNPRTIIYSPTDTLYTAYFEDSLSIQVSGPTLLVSGQNATFTATAYPSTANISWQLAGASLGTSTANTITASWATPGTYNLIATASTISDTVSDTLTITVLQGELVSYCGDGTYLDHFYYSDSSTWEWGIVLPASMLAGQTALDAVQLYVGDAGTYQLKVYSGDTNAPSTLLYSQSYTYTSATNTYETCLLSSPVNLAGIQNLWVTFTSLYAPACLYSGNRNCCWYYYSGWNNFYDYCVSNGYDSYAWMIRCVTSAAPALSINGPSTVTVNSPTTFTATTNLASATINWQLTGTTPSTASGSSVTATWPTAGTYSVIATATTATATVSDTLSVTVIQGELLSYCGDSTYALSASTGDYFDWGIMLPASMLTGYTSLNAVQLYVGVAGTYQLKIYSGTSSAPSTLLYSQSYSYSSATNAYETLILSSPLNLTGIQNLWVTFYSEYGPICNYSGDTNSCWAYFDGYGWVSPLSVTIDENNYLFSWMVRCITSTSTSASLTINGPASVPVNSPTTFSATTMLSSATITWQLPGATPNIATGDSVTATWTTAGTYNIIATATNATDTVSDTLQVHVFSCDTITTFPYTMGFESSDPTACWSFVNYDSYGYDWGWMYGEDSDYSHSGTGLMMSMSPLDENTYNWLTPDHWAISPQLQLPTSHTCTLSWYALEILRSQLGYGSTNCYQVYVSTTGTSRYDFTLLGTYSANDYWSNQTLDLSAYAGQSIRFAFRHHVSPSAVAIDDISLTTTYYVPDTVTFTCTGTGGGQVQRTLRPDNNLCGSTDIVGDGFVASYDFLPDDGSDLTHLYVNSVDRINDVYTHYSGTTVHTLNMTVSSNTTVNAIFAARTYQITATSADASMGMVTGGGTYFYDSVATLTAIPMPHYHFTYWEVTFDGWTDTTHMNPLSFEVWTDLTFVAHFAPDTYTITAQPNNVAYGNVTGGGTFAYLDPVTLSAMAYSGYRFLMWSNGNTYNPYSFPATEDLALTAIFVDENDTTQFYSLTVNVNDANMGTVSGGGAYQMGDIATLTATAFSGYHFEQWQDGNTNNPRQVTVMGDATYTAYFAPDQGLTYTLTVLVNDSTMGYVTGDGEYNAGATATLTAHAYSGYRFDRWQDGNTDNPRQVSVVADTTFTAYFATGEGIDAIDGLTLTLYPNPASDEVSIGLSGLDGHVQLFVLDASGRQVLARDMECHGDCTTLLPLNHLSQGVYFVRVVNAEGLATVRKLIVK